MSANKTTPSGLGERRSAILRALVSHYVATGEPVGSKTLVERYRLGVSPATVRNDMAALEDDGYIYQPHTSAGRIPTDAGYRHFVDSTAEATRLPARQAKQVERFFLEPRYELEDSLRQTAQLLSHLTEHAAVVFAPLLGHSVVRHVDVVPLTAGRAMVVLVASTGRVENHIVAIPETVDEVHLDRAAEMLNRMVVGQPLEKAAALVTEGVERFPLELREVATNVGSALASDLTDSSRLFLEGTSNIVDESKFPDLETVRQVVGALEHRRVLLEVLADGVAQGGISVRIGSEIPVEQMQACSVITASYGVEDQPIGSLGIVGPTRMDYRRTMAAVHEVATHLGSMLADIAL